ncbi:hypothetical protein E2562_025149 [Oryza meyeriana var. granulata]|uniref:DUF7148 domain-containing protein n=1 Tax=Oryza meyeriana var. granulata TaxID=110450 RepID=A0A6G1E0A7_9ORYZ|nr:hypothetical protein E2562_025149 [Oryza meyeriana var. granulata]
MAAARQLLVHRLSCSCSSGAIVKHTSNFSGLPASSCKTRCWSSGERLSGLRVRLAVAIKQPRAAPGKDGIVRADDDDDGVSLGTVKLPANIDIARFETLLFQWANSLCQGANLPLPVPLRVDKVEGGVRLGFMAVEDGATQVLVYIDCLVSPATAASGPVFRAIRNGPMKDQEPPGEPRIMRSLLQALQKSIQIAQV